MKNVIPQALFPALLAALLILSGCEDPTNSGEAPKPALRGAVSVSGIPRVGEALNANTSLLGGTGVLSYQWIRGESTVIEGAESAEYVPDSADVEAALKVRVSRAGYRGTIESPPSAPVEPLGDGDFSYARLHGTTKYFSLSLKKELDVSKRFTKEWDLAIEEKGDGFCYIYTNSGASAEAFGTDGQGGVWFTNKTDFDAVILADRVTDYTGANAQYADCAAYETDVLRYQLAMASLTPSRMNIMTYYGYHSGDGLSRDTVFGWSIPGPPGNPFYEFNKRAFARADGGMPPPWEPTRQVYIIRHADGVHYSKFQVYSLSYERGYIYHLGFKIQPLN